MTRANSTEADDPRGALRAHLRSAAENYGDDLPLPRGQRRAPAQVPAETPAAIPTPQSARSPDLSRENSRETSRNHAPDTATSATDPVAALAALRDEVLPCRKCKLCEGRTNVVFGDGSAHARVLFVGEAPGQTEDEQGLPFVGRAGQLLTRIIEGGMGLRRADVFIANVNKCRPPGNRDPEPDEVAACLPFLKRQIEILRPEVIVTLGKVATWNLLATTEAMKHLRGRELSYEGIPVIATWHPAYLLRNPAAKVDTWADIKRANRLLGLPEVPSRPAEG